MRWLHGLIVRTVTGDISKEVVRSSLHRIRVEGRSRKGQGDGAAADRTAPTVWSLEIGDAACG